MSAKFFVYLIVTIFTIVGMSSLNINGIFKKNKVIEARIFFFLISVSLIYLVTNFIYDLYLSSQSLSSSIV